MNPKKIVLISIALLILIIPIALSQAPIEKSKKPKIVILANSIDSSTSGETKGMKL